MTPTSPSFNRRNLLKLMGAATVATVAHPAGALHAAETPAADAGAPLQIKGRIHQGICPGVLSKKLIEEKAQICVRLGIKGMDFVSPGDWPILKKYGLVCSMTRFEGMTIPNGFNHKDNHAMLIAALRKAIEDTSAAGFSNVICMSGNRNGISDEEGLVNCTTGLKQIVGYAEEKNVTLCMELLNSKRNHKDYQCDHTSWGVELCRRVGSERFKLLYDIYHMQIMEGDVIATIRENIKYLHHFHTAGVPGRHEIDDTQELFYPAIMRAIADTGFQGFVSHEYNTNHDHIAALEQAVRICDI